MSPEFVLTAIQSHLDGVEWNADTLDKIATVLRSAGYRVRDMPGLRDKGRNPTQSASKEQGAELHGMLEALGVKCSYEYPGYISIPIGEDWFLAVGDNADTWCADVCKYPKGKYEHSLTVGGIDFGYPVGENMIDLRPLAATIKEHAERERLALDMADQLEAAKDFLQCRVHKGEDSPMSDCDCCACETAREIEPLILQVRRTYE